MKTEEKPTLETSEAFLEWRGDSSPNKQGTFGFGHCGQVT
jgi:hypothetical protein